MKNDKLIGSENAIGFDSDPKLALTCIFKK
jgi:hypothetical protein